MIAASSPLPTQTDPSSSLSQAWPALPQVVNDAKKRVLRRVVKGSTTQPRPRKQDFDDALQEKMQNRESLKGSGGPK